MNYFVKIATTKNISKKITTDILSTRTVTLSPPYLKILAAIKNRCRQVKKNSAGAHITGVRGGGGGQEQKRGVFMAGKKDLTKDELIAKEIRRLRKALKDLDKNKLAVVEPLIKTAAFTAVSLAELEETINRNGFVVEYKNGENQYGTKQSDEVKTLIALQKNLAAALKTLADIAPPTKEKKSRLKDLMGE